MNQLELDDDNPVSFIQSDDPQIVFYIQNHDRYECQYCSNQFTSNNKLYHHLCGNCNGLFNYLMLESKHDTARIFSIVIHSLAILRSMERNNHIQNEICPNKERKANILV